MKRFRCSTITTAMEELYSYGVLEGDFGRGTYIASNTWTLMMSSAPPDWGTGELAAELFPRDSMEEVFRRFPAQIPSLNYLGPLGLPELREALARRVTGPDILPEPHRWARESPDPPWNRTA